MANKLPSPLIFEVVDYAGLQYIVLFESLNRAFREKLQLSINLGALNLRLRENGYTNAS